MVFNPAIIRTIIKKLKALGDLKNVIYKINT